MAESDDAQVQLTSLVGLVRNHVTLVLTLIPILLGGLRIFAVANGDRPTLVTLLSTLNGIPGLRPVSMASPTEAATSLATTAASAKIDFFLATGSSPS